MDLLMFALFACLAIAGVGLVVSAIGALVDIAITRRDLRREVSAMRDVVTGERGENLREADDYRQER